MESMFEEFSQYGRGLNYQKRRLCVTLRKEGQNAYWVNRTPDLCFTRATLCQLSQAGCYTNFVILQPFYLNSNFNFFFVLRLSCLVYLFILS